MLNVLQVIPTVTSKIQKLSVCENDQNDAQSCPTTVAQRAILQYEDFRNKFRIERAFTITRLDDESPVLVFQAEFFDLSEVKQNNILLRVDGYARAFFILSFVSPVAANNFRYKEFELICYTKGFLPIPVDALPFLEVFTE